MKTLLIILIALCACSAGLLIILSISYLKYETPSIEDALGFGSILLFVSILLIPICYLPTIHIVSRIRHSVSHLTIIASLILIGNVPAYIFLWVARDKMGAGEGFLFSIGFIVMAVVFGLCYPLKSRSLQK